jgi:sigma-B regulation protein RsbU (phosphoserine phosphatase)
MSDSPDSGSYQGLPIGLLTLDASQAIVACDAMFCRVFCCEAADVVGRSLDELVSPRDRRGAMELARKITQYSGGLIDLIATFRIRGQDHVARLRLTRRGEGFSVFLESAAGDQNLLYRFTVLEQRWNGVFRSSDDGIIILDLEGRIVEHNASLFSLMRFRDAHGVSLSEDAVVGRLFLELVGSDFPGLAAYLRTEDGDFEERSTTAERCLELKAKPLRLPSGGRIGTFLLVRDIAEELQIAARDAIIRDTLVQARSFQRAILTAPPFIPGHHVDVAYRPVDQVGGDIYDVAMVGNRVRLFIADATGHGVPAALVTMLIKSAYEFAKHSPRGPAAVLKSLNDRIVTAHGNLDVMCTAAIADLDLETRTITYSCGGHPAPLVAASGGVEALESGGPFVGARANLSYPSWKRRLAPDEGFYMVTDGLSEARRMSGEFFGDARVRRAVGEAHELPGGVGDAILARLDSWLRPEGQDDDVTIIAIRPSPALAAE